MQQLLQNHQSQVKAMNQITTEVNTRMDNMLTELNTKYDDVNFSQTAETVNM